MPAFGGSETVWRNCGRRRACIFLFKIVGERKQLARGETIRTSEFRPASLEGLSLPKGRCLDSQTLLPIR